MTKLAGMVMSGTLELADMVTGLERGLEILMTSETLFRTWLVRLMVPMIPGGVDLKVT